MSEGFGKWQEKLAGEYQRVQLLIMEQKISSERIFKVQDLLRGASAAMASEDELQCLSYYNWLREIQ
jgi:hypothetical protein